MAQPWLFGAARAALRAQLARRSGYWRALLEMLALSSAASLLTYPLALVAGSPWTEIVALPLVLLQAGGAWRLAPGHGTIWRRGLRALSWSVLFGLLAGLVSWLCLRFVQHPALLYGRRFDDLNTALGPYLANYQLLTLGLFAPVRLLLVLWAAGRSRLRWQLAFSYLLVGVLTTLLLPIALIVTAGVASLFLVPTLVDPNDAAQRMAVAITPVVRRHAGPGEIDALLGRLLDGSAHLPTTDDQLSRELDRSDASAFSFNGVRRVLLVAPDGMVLASVGAGAAPAGAPLPDDERARVGLLIDRVSGGGCTSGRPLDGELIDSAACAIGDERAAPIAALVVENNVDVTYQWSAAVVRLTTFVLMGTNLVLNVIPLTIFVVLLVSIGSGYMLARRLTRRLERLAHATSAVAAGQLDHTVAVDAPDEVGRLGSDFNAMAAQLQAREQALAAAAARADALLQSNRRLVANVSHELRTPLATLRGYLEALAQEHGEHLPAHDLEVIQREAQRLTGLIDDLFTLARAEAQQLPLTLEPVDAAAVGRRLAETLAPLARRERQIEVVAALPPALPPVLADRKRLEQVLLNLIQNALRHTPPGGIVAIEGLAAGDAHVTLAVADTGVGIAPDELPLVFERFYRSDSSRARETGGAGLGLALAHELVAAMGGTVSAESQPGRGSRFSVTLCRAP